MLVIIAGVPSYHNNKTIALTVSSSRNLISLSAKSDFTSFAKVDICNHRTPFVSHCSTIQKIKRSQQTPQ